MGFQNKMCHKIYAKYRTRNIHTQIKIYNISIRKTLNAEFC